MAKRVGISQEVIDGVRRELGIILEKESWRGPHQGIEHVLVEKHGKLLGLVNSNSKLVLNSRAYGVEKVWSNDFKSYIVYKPEGKKWAGMMVRAREMYDRGLISWRSYTVRMGICLGYSDDQIRKFIMAAKQHLVVPALSTNA